MNITQRVSLNILNLLKKMNLGIIDKIYMNKLLILILFSACTQSVSFVHENAALRLDFDHTVPEDLKEKVINDFKRLLASKPRKIYYFKNSPLKSNHPKDVLHFLSTRLEGISFTEIKPKNFGSNMKVLAQNYGMGLFLRKIRDFGWWDTLSSNLKYRFNNHIRKKTILIFDYYKKNYEKFPFEYRMSLWIHEARHSDCKNQNHLSCGHPHTIIVRKKNQKFPVDQFPNGPYTLQTLYLRVALQNVPKELRLHRTKLNTLYFSVFIKSYGILFPRKYLDS